MKEIRWTKEQIRQAAKQTLKKHKFILNCILDEMDLENIYSHPNRPECGYCMVAGMTNDKSYNCRNCVNHTSCFSWNNYNVNIIEVLTRLIYHQQSLDGDVFPASDEVYDD